MVALVRDGEPVDTLTAGETGILLTNQTPFYGESGGQMGDTGVLSADGLEISVTDTGKALGALHTHQVSVQKGSVSCGDVLDMQIDAKRRDALRANHSATHLLHAVLRQELGEHVTQKGSLVAPDRLRFDISHPSAISAEERRRIEARVNALIRHNSDVDTRVMSYDEAIESGALALFGEKYGDEVRVLFMGDGFEETSAVPFSVELCGGTHVGRLGDIGAFTIVSEGAVAAGIRRLEALTGQAALDYLQSQEDQLLKASEALKSSPSDLVERIASLVQERKRLEKELGDTKKQLALSGGASGGPKVEEIGGIKFLGQVLDGFNPKDLRGLATESLASLGSGVVAYV